MADLVGLLRDSGLYAQYEVVQVHPDFVRMPYTNATLNMQKISRVIGQYLIHEALLISSDLEMALKKIEQEKPIAKPKTGKLRSYCIPYTNGNGNQHIDSSKDYELIRLYNAIIDLIKVKYKGQKVMVRTSDTGSNKVVNIDAFGNLIGSYKGPWIYYKDRDRMTKRLESMISEVKGEGSITLILIRINF